MKTSEGRYCAFPSLAVLRTLKTDSKMFLSASFFYTSASFEPNFFGSNDLETFRDLVSSSLTALFSFAFLLCQLGLKLSLIGPQTAVHLLLLLQLLAQLHHPTVQLSAPEKYKHRQVIYKNTSFRLFGVLTESF